MKITLLIISFIVQINLIAQAQIKLSDLDGKNQKKYNKAIKDIESKKFDQATKDISDIIIKYPDFTEGQLKLTSLYLRAEYNDLAIKHLKYILDNKLAYQPKLILTLAELLEEKGEYNQALTYLQPIVEDKRLSPKSLKKVKRRFDELTFREYTYSNPVVFEPRPISNLINTEKSECLPAFKADGSVMIYTSMDQNAGRNANEDLFISTIDSSGNFSKGKNIASLNTSENEGAHTFSQDGTIIIFTACNRRDSYGGCDLYISFLKNGKWGEAYNMGPDVNSRYTESQPSLSSDNKTLYFSSTRKGGIGKEDIWKVSFEKGKWGSAKNLGPTINTSNNEGSPFIHPDDNTLYFRSDGHIGLGGYDLFITRKDQTSWSIPENLGYPINSKTNDGALFVDLFGQTAYYTSDKFNKGQHLDILKFELPNHLKPKAVSYLKIKVRDAISKEIISADINITEINTGKSIKSIKSNQEGKIIVIQKGMFALTVNKTHYLLHSENINIDKSASQNDPFVFEVNLIPITEKKVSPTPVTLHNIFFESGSSQLLNLSNVEIEKLVELLNNEPEINIKIIGHTDNVGNSQDNLTLSEDRAKAVYARLITNGIDAKRLSYKGKGESEPITDNDTPEGRKTNRRTTFIVVPK